MSTYRTYKMIDALQDFSQDLLNIGNTTNKKECIDMIINLSNHLYIYKYATVCYYKPSIINYLYTIFDSNNNILQDAYTLGQIDEEQYEDYKLMLQDAKERLSDIILPEKSFFFTYMDGEYYSIIVDDDGLLVEEYKYDQKIEYKKTYHSVIDWMNMYAIKLDDIEFAVCLDLIDDDVCNTFVPSELPILSDISTV